MSRPDLLTKLKAVPVPLCIAAGLSAGLAVMLSVCVLAGAQLELRHATMLADGVAIALHAHILFFYLLKPGGNRHHGRTP